MEKTMLKISDHNGVSSCMSHSENPPLPITSTIKGKTRLIKNNSNISETVTPHLPPND
jgi:hypothetical protein